MGAGWVVAELFSVGDENEVWICPSGVEAVKDDADIAGRRTVVVVELSGWFSRVETRRAEI